MTDYPGPEIVGILETASAELRLARNRAVLNSEVLDPKTSQARSIRMAILDLDHEIGFLRRALGFVHSDDAFDDIPF